MRELRRYGWCTLALGLALAACSAEMGDEPGSSVPVMVGGSDTGGASNDGSDGSPSSGGSGFSSTDFGNPGQRDDVVDTGPPSDNPGVEQGCATADVRLSRVTPIVWLVIDGSDSMSMPLGSSATSRWDAMRTALVGTNGVVPRLEPVVQFGMALYDGLLGDFGMASGPECPNLQVVNAMLDNGSAIEMAFPGQPLGGSTPTHKTMQHIVDSLPDLTSSAVLDMDPDPIYIVLATDGEPNDACADATSVLGPHQPSRDGVVAATMEAAAKGIKTYVISLAADNADLRGHLVDVATAGDTGLTDPFEPDNPDALVDTLSEIIGDAVSCEIDLNGELTPGLHCDGSVVMDGNALDCDSDNGWRLVNPSRIELTGSACETFRSATSSTLHAEFPCGAFAPD